MANLEQLFAQSVSDVICSKCQEYQRKYGKPPGVIAINSKLFNAIMMDKKQPDDFCGEVIYFVASKSSVIANPDKEWLMLGDENWKWKEWL